MSRLTYDQLNDAVHAAAAIIDESTGSECDRAALNNAISSFLADANIHCYDEEDEDDA